MRTPDDASVVADSGRRKPPVSAMPGGLKLQRRQTWNKKQIVLYAIPNRKRFQVKI